MFRSLLQLMCSAWIAAVLLVSPALAALDCGCCQPVAKSAGHDDCCPHCSPAKSSGCCEVPAGQPAEPCHECPTCQLRQGPVPATVGTERVVHHEAPQFVAVLSDRPADPVIRTLDLTSVSDRDHSPPPTIMVLNCRWQK